MKDRASIVKPRENLYPISGRGFARKVKDPNYRAAEVQLQCQFCGNEVSRNQVQEWPGLPAGVKFDPTDKEILEHLAAQVGHQINKPHPFINEFIPTLTEEDGICYTHPEKLPGVRRDGTSTHFFHTPTRAYTTGNRKRRKIQSSEDGEIRWHKTGKTRPVLENGVQFGCKKIMVLYVSAGKKKKPEKTNWVMHQYHLGSDEEEREGELVVSKVFYQVQPRQIGPTGKDDVEEPGDVLEQVALEQVVEQSSCVPEPGHSHPKGLFVSLCEQVNNLEASLGEKQIEASISDPKIEKSVSTNENTSSVEICGERQNSNTEVCLDDASQSELQEDHPLNLGSMPFSGSFDPELLKLLCSESLEGFSQGDGTSDWKSLIAEVCSKRESQDAFSLDKVSLGTPPDLLDQLFSSQGSFADWAEKLKLFSDSQKTEDFNLADFLQSSQPLP